MATIVTFNSNGARIYEGADEKDFKDQNYLVNPKFPRGIAPNEWKLHPKGYIMGTEAPAKIKDYNKIKYLACMLAGMALMYLLRRI